MTLNGHTNDGLLAEFLKCRSSMRAVKDERPDAETYISISSDRGLVGSFISRFEGEILPEIEPEVFEMEWDCDMRAARLHVLSELTGREINTVWDLMFFELRGILDWLVVYDGTNWVLQDGPAKVIRALAMDDEFNLLVEALPRE
jgi:hypothetical protein